MSVLPHHEDEHDTAWTNFKAKVAHKLLESCLAHRYPKPKRSIHFEFIDEPPYKYRLLSPLHYYSERYDKHVTVPDGYKSDGATGARDVASRAWFLHDWLCDHKQWNDGSYCSRWQGSTVLADVLKEDGHNIVAPFWRLATWIIDPLNRD